MSFEADSTGGGETRRRVLGLIGGTSVAGGMALLSACKSDGIVGSESVPVTSPTTAPVAPPAYVATDNDRLNFALQLHYLVAAYLQRSLDGGTLSPSLTSGAGIAGTVSGGRAVTFTDPMLLASVREVTVATTGRIGYLRRILGTAATAQPAINISGGSGSPFQAIGIVAPAANASAPTTFFDPYVSENDFLLGGIALFAVATSSITALAPLVDVAVRGAFGAFSAGVAASDAVLRNALYVRASAEAAPAAGTPSLFERTIIMSGGRDQYDGPADRDQGLGDRGYANIGITVDNNIAVRRTPEQALSVLYASATVAPSGGFFPAGVNGVIRSSGLNA